MKGRSLKKSSEIDSKPKKREKNSNKKPWIILGVIIILIIFLVFVTSTLNGDVGTVNQSNVTNITNNTSVQQQPTSELLSNNSNGTVTREGPYGNSNSPVKVAYVLNVNSRLDKYILMDDSIKSKSSELEYCYYIYKINATSKTNNSDNNLSSVGSLVNNRRSLIKDAMVSDISSQNFNLVVDVHYTNDSNFNYIYGSNENRSLESTIAKDIANDFDWLNYYSNEYNSSIAEELGNIPLVTFYASAQPENTIISSQNQNLIEFIDGFDILGYNNTITNNTNVTDTNNTNTSNAINNSQMNNTTNNNSTKNNTTRK
ncbi:MAG: hypothetical protein Q4Q23_05755 [Methanobacteriaceae archaeon]|nr:hypothetical protein [Methanobacteriaceae archaeon]